MKTLQSAQEQSTTQISQDSQSEQQNNHKTEAPVADSSSISASSNDGRKVSRQDIELVQNLIERCLQLYMNRDEVVKTLLTRARIDPGFTTLVWQKLEEENADFFRAYYIRLKLKKQILLFNHLLEHQYHLMKYPVPSKVPLVPMQNGMHPMPVNNLPMGYPVLQQTPMPAPGQPHLDSMSCGISSCHVVNGVPAPGNFHPIRMNSGNDMVMGNSAADTAHAVPPSSAISSMSEMPVSPTSVTSSGHFPFTTSDMSGIGVDSSALDTAFSDVASSVGLQLGPDGGAGNSRSLDHFQWNFSLSDLTEDLSNLGDLGALGNYPGSPFLPSDSEILLDSPSIAAITGHASAGGMIFALCHDYVIMRRDRGFLYMSELDIGLVVPAWFVALLECKIGNPKARRDMVLKAAKLTAEMAAGKGIVDMVGGNAEETVEAAVRLGEEMFKRKWDGQVYAKNRMVILGKVLDKLGFDETVEEENGKGNRSKL